MFVGVPSVIFVVRLPYVGHEQPCIIPEYDLET
jgi:hypothetical protein